MVSTQTSLTCARSDNLLPQSLLFNIITSKLAEAFEITNLHAKLCDYTDNLRSIKKEPNEPTYQFTCNYPDIPHLDLVIPSNCDLHSPIDRGCFSPNTFLPRKRQRLHSTLSPASAIQETIGLSAPASFTCPNCKSTYKSLGGLNYHVQRCQNMVYNKPLTTACKQLSFEPDNPTFAGDEPVGTDITHSNPISNHSKLKSPVIDSQSGITFITEREQETEDCTDEVMVAYLVGNCDTLVQEMDKQLNSIEAEDVADMGSDDVGSNDSSDNANRNDDSSDNTTRNDDSSDNAATRKSTRIKSRTQRQIRSKVLLDRIKQAKKQTASRNYKKDKNSRGRNSKTSKDSVESKLLKQSPKLTLKKRLNEIKLESKDSQNEGASKRTVINKPNKRLNVKVEVPLKGKITSNDKPAEIKPSVPCNYCVCVFQSKWNAKRHEYTVHGVGTPLTSDDLASRQTGSECQECKESTGSVTMVTESTVSSANIPDDDTTWVCGVCGKNLLQKDQLVEHRKIHENLQPPIPQGQGMFVCQVCFKKYESGISLMNHVNRQHNPSLTCSLCYKIFSSQIALSSHSCSSDIQISCRHCPKTFKSHSDHIKHVRNVHASLTHSLNQSACKLCDYTFSSALKYRVHQTISHPTHDMLCQLCNTTLSSRDQLIEHVHKHHATLPFLCTVCEKGFSNQDSMTKHRSEHFK